MGFFFSSLSSWLPFIPSHLVGVSPCGSPKARLLVRVVEQRVCPSGSFIPAGKNYHVNTLIFNKNNLCDSDKEVFHANKLQLATPRFVSSALATY